MSALSQAYLNNLLTAGSFDHEGDDKIRVILVDRDSVTDSYFAGIEFVNEIDETYIARGGNQFWTDGVSGAEIAYDTLTSISVTASGVVTSGDDTSELDDPDVSETSQTFNGVVLLRWINDETDSPVICLLNAATSPVPVNGAAITITWPSANALFQIPTT